MQPKKRAVLLNFFHNRSRGALSAQPLVREFAVSHRRDGLVAQRGKVFFAVRQSVRDVFHVVAIGGNNHSAALLAYSFKQKRVGVRRGNRAAFGAAVIKLEDYVRFRALVERGERNVAVPLSAEVDYAAAVTLYEVEMPENVGLTLCFERYEPIILLRERVAVAAVEFIGGFPENIGGDVRRGLP